MDSTVEGAAASSQIVERLADILGQIGAFRDGAGRHVMAQLWAEETNAAVRLGGGSARAQLIAFARACVEQPYGLTALLHLVDAVEPRTMASAELLAVRDEFSAIQLLPADWDRLARILRPLRLAETEAEELPVLRRLARMATSGRLDELPAQCRSAWTTFLHLVDYNAEPGRLPPAMVFLAAVAKWVGRGITAFELDHWNHRWAEQLGVAEALWQLPWRDVVENDPATVYLMFELDPDPFVPDTFLLSYWRQWNGPAQRQGAAPVALRDVEATVDEVIGALEADLGAGAAGERVESEIFLEFFLPWELLNLPVEFWRRGSDFPLAVDYPVVVRSLERMRNPGALRQAWRRRWQALESATRNVRPYWSRAIEPSAERMALELRQDDSIVSLVLSEPPGERGGRAWSEASAAFQAGVPVLIWDREDCSAPAFRNVVNDLAKRGGLAQLPQRVAQLRREALAHPDTAHPGRTIAVLWDDPHRLPVNQLWDVKGSLP